MSNKETCSSSEKLPRWNLSDLYESDSDPRIKEDLKTGRARAEKFAADYRGLVKDGKTEAAPLAKALREYEDLLVFISKPSDYTDLRFSVDSKNTALAALNQYCTEEISSICAENLVFFDLEIGSISDETWNSISGDPALAVYKHYIEGLRAAHKHFLSEPEEKLLEQTSVSGRQAFCRLFSELVSRLKYPIEIDGEKKELTQSELLALFYDPDRNKRRLAAEVLSRVLNSNAHAIHFTYNTLVLDKLTSDKLRGYSRPESSRNLGNDIDDDVVDMVIDTVRANYKTVSGYYKLKARLLGLDTLYHYDRYAPLSEVKVQIPFDKAKDTVLEAFRSFDPKFADGASQFFEKNWIDVPVAEGKRGGAFCAGIAPGMHPYVMLNYTGRSRDVQTLAHELGHGIHDLLASGQTYLNYHPVLPLAETASTFAEMVVFDKLFAELEDPYDRLALLAEKIEDTFATVFRQAAMYTFEQRVYAARATEGELSLERINALWQESIGEMFGDSVTLGPDHAITWLYVPHFVYTPFYVYAYSFGELLVYCLYARYRREGESFKQKYLHFLASGGSKSPKDLLAELDIDIRSREFWQGGCDLIADRVAEVERLAEEIEAEERRRCDPYGDEDEEGAGKGWGDGDEDGWDGSGEDDEIIDPSERGF